MYGVRECSNLILFACSCPVAPAPLTEENVSVVYAFRPCLDGLVVSVWVSSWTSGSVLRFCARSALLGLL